MSDTYIVNGQVYIDHTFQEKTIHIQDGKLRLLEPGSRTGGTVFDAAGKKIVPGFIDIHTHGAVGVDVNGALDDMPRWCVTIGMNEIYNARKIRLGCFRDWHRSVVRHAAYGEVSAHFPVTLLQDHPDALLRFTEFVAELPD